MENRFEVVEFNDPAFAGTLLPLIEEYVRRNKMEKEIKPEDIVRQIAIGLFSNAPIRIYLLVDKESKEIAAMVYLTSGHHPPRVWVEIIAQSKKYAKYRAAKYLWGKVEEQLKLWNIQEVYAMVRRSSNIKLFMKEGGFIPAEIVMRKKIAG